jgi:hypothetical protein
MRIALALTGLVLLPAARAYADEPLRLETPTKVDALKVADVDGDGASDLVTLSGRTVCVWTSGKDALPPLAPRWKVVLPDDVTFVDVARHSRPALICVASDGAFRLPLDSDAGRAREPIPDASALGWRDAGKAVFAALHPGPATNDTFVFPRGPASWGVAAGGASTEAHLPVSGMSEVTAAGPFLEDVAVVVSSTPGVFTSAPRSEKPRAEFREFWHVAGDTLWLQRESGLLVLHQEVDLSFLPASGERRLLDLDGNGTPDVIHRDGDNRERRYAFFRVPTPSDWPRDPQRPDDMVPESKVPDLRPPAAFLRLSGFNLDPDYVDVDGDGLVDFVVTTMALDGPNIFRAVATGKVTATTLAFLQRKQAPNVPMFPTQPDATVVSEIGVKIRFAHTGTIDVKQSFTILATGDVDGDGRKDLVIRSGPGTLRVRRGTVDGVWAKEATAVAMPAVGPGEECEATAANLDGKAGAELVLLYRAAEAAPDRLVVLKP